MHIKPKLSRFDLTMIVISLIIGTGIFKSPGEVALRSGSTTAFFAAWVVGGLVTLCGALTFAEIGARYPTTGGFYKLFSYCYHPAFAFMINWVAILSTTASVAAVALIGAEYVNPLILPLNLQTATGAKITTITLVLLVYVINFLGIKMSARAQNLLTIFKVGMIAVLCLAIFKSDGFANTAHAAVVPATTPFSISAFGLSLVAVFFTYTGYQQTINFGGDIINPKLNIPKAIFMGIAVVIAVYLTINYAYFYVLGMPGLRQNTGLAAKMALVVFGNTGYKVTSVLMFVSVMAYVNVSIMSVPRVYYAMAEDGMLPAIFKRINPRTQTQEFGMSVFVASILLILLFANSFGDMLDYTMFFETIGLSTAAMAIFILRKRTHHLNNTGIYTIKWYPLVPLIFIVVLWFVTFSIFVSKPKAALICMGAFAAGLVIYYLTRRLSKASGQPS